MSVKSKFLISNLFIWLFNWIFSFFEKKEVYNKLEADQKDLSDKILVLEKKNSLLTENIDLDFIEILIREKFLFGKEGETTYIIKDDETKN